MDREMDRARRLRFLFLRLGLLAFAIASVGGRAEEKSKPFVLALKSYGIPDGLFVSRNPFGCLHERPAATSMFWLDGSHIFVAFTTDIPCGGKSQSPERLRAIVFDTTGARIASRDWPVEGELDLFAGPDHTIVLRQGVSLQFVDDHLQIVDTGKFDESPKEFWVTPEGRTMPILSADGQDFEFYGIRPLKLVSTIGLGQSAESKSVIDWIPGDERVAGARCREKETFSCNKILVLTADVNFLAADGAPWSYEEANQAVSLRPISFLDSTHLLISRTEKKLFHGGDLAVITPDGSKAILPNAGTGLRPHKTIGVAGSRFGLEYTPDHCDACDGAKGFTVIDLVSRKVLFKKLGSAYFSRSQLSPDGKSMAILDNGAIDIYPLPGPGN
jgi:hypothetical protein